MKLMHEPTQAELHPLTRYTARAAARHRDGLDLELFFTPAASARIGAVAMHPRALGALARFRVAEMVARDVDEAPLRSAPALCLLYADSLDAETFLRGGACFEEIALDVTEAGLAMALHSAPVEVGLSPPRPAAPVGARRVARGNRRGAPRAAGRVRCRAAGRADRLLPARVADPRTRAPEPAAPTARASGPRPLTTGR